MIPAASSASLTASAQWLCPSPVEQLRRSIFMPEPSCRYYLYYIWIAEQRQGALSSCKKFRKRWNKTAGENVIYSRSNILSASWTQCFILSVSHTADSSPYKGEPRGNLYNVTYRKEHSHEENNISDTDSTAARISQDARADGKAHPVKAQHISRRAGIKNFSPMREQNRDARRHISARMKWSWFVTEMVTKHIKNP